jgi:hypothetical protein
MAGILPASLRLLGFDQTPTITSEALITAVAFMPAFGPSFLHASLVIEAVMVTVGDTSIFTSVVVVPERWQLRGI